MTERRKVSESQSHNEKELLLIKRQLFLLYEFYFSLLPLVFSHYYTISIEIFRRFRIRISL